MLVVPPLTESEDPKEIVVSAMIAGPERLAAPKMIDRIDAPSHMMDQDFSRQATPQQAGQDV